MTLGRARAGRARWLTRRDVLSAAQSERAALPAEGSAGRWARCLLGLSGEAGCAQEEAAGLGSEGKRAERAGVGLPRLS